jgi:outer membrane protein OmpA-like peptidoglycan-associated protein
LDANKKIARYSTLVLTLLLMESVGIAQARFDAQRFSPSPDQALGYFSQPTARTMQDGQYQLGLVLNFADDPLVVNSSQQGLNGLLQRALNGERVSSIISSQLVAHLLFGIGIGDQFQIGADVPLILLQSGDSITALDTADAADAGFSPGDIRLVPKLMLVGSADPLTTEGFFLSLLLETRLPTGNADNFQGEGFRIEPRLAAEYMINSNFRAAVAVGYMVRDESNLENVEIDDSLTWSAALGIGVSDDLEIVPEIFGQVSVLADEINLEETPMEAVLGVKWSASDAVVVSLGGALGVIRGVGTPDFRAFIGLSYSSPSLPDRDGDGYVDSEDGCPDEPEDFDQFEDEDGCPDPDNDSDTILDIDDDCPMQPEDFDEWEDADGCADPDNDADQILDADDTCPVDPEDHDGYEDEDGCPDPDNDSDTILDVDDDCPMEPENVNGYQDEDGCPDIEVTCEAIEITESVFFGTDSDVIQTRSFELLNVIARTIADSPGIEQIRIEGHTDDRASREHNLDLSTQRANSVRDYLINQGVAGERLTAEGFGETQPIANNATETGRAQNRRVMFVITAQQGCEDQAETP